MPTLQEAFRAAALAKAQRALVMPTGRKAIVPGGPLLRPGMTGRPLQNRDWLPERAIDRYFKASAIVYRGVIASATAVGSVRWQAEVKTRDRWEVAEDSELQTLLDQPHEFFNRQAWTEVLVMYLALTGNALFQKTVASGRGAQGASKGRILEMIPLVPQGINPVPDSVTWISRYEYAGPPKKVWKPEEMLHVMLPDPGNPYWGFSPLKAAADVIAMDLESVRWNATSMANRSISDGVFSVEPALTTDQYDELKDQVWEQHQGADRAHEPWVLGGSAKWLPMERTPVEMDFNTSRMRAREEILSSLGMPPVMAGYFENATLANADVSRRIFWEDNATPTYVERIVGALNSSVVPHFGDKRKLRVGYDISGVPALRDDQVKKATTLSVFVRCGVPYNHALRELELDLEEIPGAGDVPFGLEAGRVSAAGETDADEPTTEAPAVGTEQDVAVSEAAVLSGAQITAATAIVTAVAAGEMPRDSGLGQLEVLFNLTAEQALQLMGSAGTATPTTPNPKPRAEGSPEPADPPAEGEVPPQLADTMLPAKRSRPRYRKLSIRTGVFATTIADDEAPAIRRAFLAEIAKLRQGVSVSELAALVRAADAAAAIAKLGGGKLQERLLASVGKGIEQTARRGADLAASQLARDLGAELGVDASRMARWLLPYLNERTAQLTNTTEAAAREFFFDLNSGRLGDDTESAAKLLRESWGLHKQQAAGVRNVYADGLAAGKSPAEAVAAAAELAKARLIERASTIAEHESLIAANRGNGLMFEQAIADGAVAQVTATWGTAEDGDEDGECASLNDQEIDVGANERFVGASGNTYREPPEPHPNCRCLLLYGATA